MAAIEHACGRRPDYEVGKPNTLLLEMITAEDDVKPHEVLVVGDVLESDIAMAHHFGSPSVLVSATEANAESDVQPVITLSALEELPTLLLAACQYRQGS